MLQYYLVFNTKKNRAIRTFCSLIILVSLFRYLIELSVVRTTSDFFDFSLFQAYSGMVAKGINPFDSDIYIKAGGAIQTANYPPLFYVLMWPFSLLSFEAASGIWFVMNQTLIVFVIVILFRIIRDSFNLVNLTLVIFLFTNYYPIYFNNILGQSNVLVLFLITFSLYLLTRKHVLLAAISIALAIHIKIQFALFLPVFFVVGYRKLSIFTTALVLLGWVVSVLILGLGHNIDYFNYLIHFPSALYFWHGNISIPANIVRVVGYNRMFVSIVGILLPLIFIGYVKYLAIRSKPLEAIDVWSFTVLGILLCSPLLETHHLVIGILPIVGLLFAHTEHFSMKDSKLQIFAVLSVVLISCSLFVNPTSFVGGWSTVPSLMTRTFGLLGLFWVFIRIGNVNKVNGKQK